MPSPDPGASTAEEQQRKGTKHMKAWRFTGTHDPMQSADLPEPQPGPGEVLVSVRAAGICHSDVGIFEDEKWLAQMAPPVTPGHEISGVVEALGDGAGGLAVGDRVTVLPVCPGRGTYGYDLDGGFGEKVIAPTAVVQPIPGHVPFELAAIVGPATTAYCGVLGTGRVQAGEKVGIIGYGGLGQLAAQFAVQSGAELYVAEINEALWERALQAGAKRVVRDITELASEGLHAVIDFAGFGTTTAGAVEAVGDRGRVVLVGMGLLESTINTYPLIKKQAQILGSSGGSDEDTADVVRWMADGRLSPAFEYTDWAGIPDGIARLARGEIRGRLVAMYS